MNFLLDALKKRKLEQRFKKESELVKSLLSEEDDAYIYIYSKALPIIESVARSRYIDMDDAHSLFDERLMKFLEKVRESGFEEKKEGGTVNYLINGFKNELNNFSETKNRRNSLAVISSVAARLYDNTLDYESLFIKNEELAALKDLVKSLGEPCATIMWSFYIEGIEPIELIESGNIPQKTLDSLKNARYRCMQKLREKAIDLDLEIFKPYKKVENDSK